MQRFFLIRSSTQHCSPCQYNIAFAWSSLLGPPLNIWPLKTFACVSLRYRKRHGVVGDNKTKSKKVKKVTKVNKVKKVFLFKSKKSKKSKIVKK